MLEACRVNSLEPVFGVQAAGRVMTEAFAPWVQDLGILVDTVESGRPPSAPHDWQPGAVLRLPFGPRICRDGSTVCGQALVALADAAIVIACSAAWNSYRPMAPVDQTMHFLRPVDFEVVADARVVRISWTSSFGRVMLYNARDKLPVGMVATSYAVL
jgi:acyl-coenzyme A thioesterase PaaI-like protein